MTTIASRIITALAGPAVAAGVIAAGIALGAPAQASTSTNSCVTAAVTGAPQTMLNPLTRAGQVAAAYAPEQVPAPATSCIGH